MFVFFFGSTLLSHSHLDFDPFSGGQYFRSIAIWKDLESPESIWNQGISSWEQRLGHGNHSTSTQPQLPNVCLLLGLHPSCGAQSAACLHWSTTNYSDLHRKDEDNP